MEIRWIIMDAHHVSQIKNTGVALQALHSKSLKPQIVCCNFGHAFSKVPRIGVCLRKMFLALLSSKVSMDFEHLRMKPEENPRDIWSSSPDFGLSGSSSGTCVGVATLRLHVCFHTEGEGRGMSWASSFLRRLGVFSGTVSS